MLLFPLADVTGKIVDLTQPASERQTKLDRKLFVIGFVIMAICFFLTEFYDLLILGSLNMPTKGFLWGTSIYAWPSNANMWFNNQALPYVDLFPDLGPQQIAWMFFLSLDTLVGVVLAWLVFWVIIQVIVGGAGLYSSPWDPAWHFTFPVNAWFGGSSETAFKGPLLGIGTGIYIGTMLGLLIYPLWRGRRTVAAVIKTIWTTPEESEAAHPPINYRITWVLLFVGLLLWLVGAYLWWVPLGPYLVWIIIWGLTLAGSWRMFAFTGGYWGMWANDCCWCCCDETISRSLGLAIRHYSGIKYWGPTKEHFGYLLATSMSRGWLRSEYIPYAGGMWSLNSFKLGQILKVSKRTILKTLIYGGFVVLLLAGFAVVLNLGISPATDQFRVGPWMPNLAVPNLVDVNPFWANGQMRTETEYMYNITIAQQSWILGVIVGLVMIVGLYILRQRMPWFRLNPEGIAFGQVF